HRDAVDAGVADEGDHVVAVAAKGHRIDVFYRDAEFPGDEGLKAGRVEDAGLTNDAVVGKAGDFLAKSDHGVERIGDNDDDGVGGILLDPLGYLSHDLGVDLNQVVAAHSRLAGQTGGDDHHVGAFDILVVVGTPERDVESVDRGSLCNVQHLT